jgi:Ca2+-binding EF-hand superfamily protein
MFMRARSKAILLSICAMLALSLPAYGDEASRNKEIAERFAKCDTNRDGKLTMNEAKGCMPRIYDHFSYIDTGNKGYVTVAEIQTMAAR